MTETILQSLPPETVISTLLVIVSTLSIYLLILRIRDFHKERPDPKLTYAPKSDLDKLRRELSLHQRDHKRDCERIQAEHKADHMELNRRRSQSMGTLRTLIVKNTEHLAALQAQHLMMQQRLSELSLKTDKLQEKQN